MRRNLSAGKKYGTYFSGPDPQHYKRQLFFIYFPCLWWMWFLNKLHSPSVIFGFFQEGYRYYVVSREDFIQVLQTEAYYDNQELVDWMRRVKKIQNERVCNVVIVAFRFLQGPVPAYALPKLLRKTNSENIPYNTVQFFFLILNIFLIEKILNLLYDCCNEFNPSYNSNKVFFSSGIQRHGIDLTPI